MKYRLQISYQRMLFADAKFFLKTFFVWLLLEFSNMKRQKMPIRACTFCRHFSIIIFIFVQKSQLDFFQQSPNRNLFFSRILLMKYFSEFFFHLQKICDRPQKQKQNAIVGVIIQYLNIVFCETTLNFHTSSFQSTTCFMQMVIVKYLFQFVSCNGVLIGLKCQKVNLLGIFIEVQLYDSENPHFVSFPKCLFRQPFVFSIFFEKFFYRFFLVDGK